MSRSGSASSAAAQSNQESRRSVVITARFWAVTVLTAAVVAIELLMIIRLDRSAPRGGWLWPIVGLVALVCWRFRRARFWTTLLLIVQLIILWSAVLFPRTPVTEQDGVVSGLGRALLAVGAADLLRCTAAAIALLACVLSFGSLDAGARRRTAGIVAGIVGAAALIMVCVPAGYGLRSVSRTRVINSAEQSEIFSTPSTAGSSAVTIDGHSGWSRAKIIAAQPAGDRVIATESATDADDAPAHAIVGLRSIDGDLLWRYRLKASPRQDSVGATVIDQSSRMIMTKYSGALIGLDFDGRVRYRRPLPETVDPRSQPILVGDTLGHPATVLQLGSVAVFGGNYADGVPAGFATGYAVATGERLWQYTANSKSCEFAQAAGPGRLVYLLTGGHSGCRTELVGYQDASATFRNTLHAPTGYVRPRSGAASGFGSAETTPTIAAVGADRVAVSPLWSTDRSTDGDDALRQIRTQIFDSGGALQGTLAVGVAPYASLRMLPTPLSDGPTSDLGIVTSKAGTSGQVDRWVSLTPQLRPKAASDLKSGAGYQRVGSWLVSWPWEAASGIAWARIGSTLGPVETVKPTDLPHCGQQISWISSDGTRLAIRCGQTLLVTRA